MKANWYEVWADEGLAVPYILLLRPVPPGAFEIIDPAEGNRRVLETTDYQEARVWLLEDEYVLVARKELDEYS